MDDIREMVLPSYKPVRALTYLTETTGFEWVYDSTLNFLCIYDENQRYLKVYDVRESEVWLEDDLVAVTQTYTARMVKMSPQTFIEKITKGEWI